MARFAENTWRFEQSSGFNPAVDIDAQKLAQMWTKVRTGMRSDIGEVAYKNWVQPLSFLQLHNTSIQMAAPNRAVRDWVLSRYGDRLRKLWVEQCPMIKAIEIIITSNDAGTEKKKSLGTIGGKEDLQPVKAEIENIHDLMSISAPLDPRYTFDNFIVGKPNELAFAAARRVAESEKVPFNPLFLYGGVGLGKTHLMHAIAWHITKKSPGKKVLYLSAEKFMYQFIRALRHKDTVAFKDLFRSVDVLMIDDVQFIGGKESTQEEFFHTFNALVDQNRQVIISADKSPSDLEGLEERMRSRLGWGLVVDIHPTDIELRLSILKSKADSLKVSVPENVLEFLAHKITSNVRELEGALNRLVAHSTLVGREINLENTQELLRDLLRASDRKITIDEIQRRVAEHFNIRLTDMHSPRRARVVARPRQVAMYLAKQLTQRSLPEIGRKFGGRDHTTVMHAVRKIDDLCQGDAGFAGEIDLLRKMLEQ